MRGEKRIPRLFLNHLNWHSLHAQVFEGLQRLIGPTMTCSLCAYILALLELVHITEVCVCMHAAWLCAQLTPSLSHRLPGLCSAGLASQPLLLCAPLLSASCMHTRPSRTRFSVLTCRTLRSLLLTPRYINTHIQYSNMQSCQMLHSACSTLSMRHRRQAL